MIENLEIKARLESIAKEVSSDPLLGSLIQKQELENFLHSGLSCLLQTALNKDRQIYLQDHSQDRGNGFSPSKTLRMGTTPMEVQLPRTRDGFYPVFLPKHQRCLPESYEELLSAVLLQAKSFRSALRTLQAMNLGYSPEKLEDLLEELDQEAKAFWSRPLAADWLFLYVDAKVIQLKDEHHQVKTAIHFLVIGLSMEGRKEILISKIFWGHEQLECWKQVFIDLKNRGLTRVLMILTDDFSGLTSLISSLFPHSDHQLCCVHLFRNAQRHLSVESYALFQQTWKEIFASSSFETAQEKFRHLLEKLRPQQEAYVKHLEVRIHHYLAFMKYPQPIRCHIHSTNLPEGINNLIETLKRNAGGHFHSEREARIKLKLLTDNLYAGKWKHPNATFKANLQALMNIFKSKFESELPPNFVLTQNF